MASLFPNLPTLNGQPGRACPKPSMTRLDEKVDKDAKADKAWDDCKKTVDKRDGIKCRCCKQRTVVTIELDPKRSEHHHIVKRRKEKGLLTDPRNVIRVCLKCHQKLEKHQLSIIGKAADMFEYPVGSGKFHLNADSKELKFVA